MPVDFWNYRIVDGNSDTPLFFRYYFIKHLLNAALLRKKFYLIVEFDFHSCINFETSGRLLIEYLLFPTAALPASGLRVLSQPGIKAPLKFCQIYSIFLQ